MKNFLRSLRYSWAYRRRLLLSLVCALCAAVFWSLNFTAIYPVLKLLGTDLTLQQWVDKRIDEVHKAIAAQHAHRALLELESRNLRLLPENEFRVRRELEVAAELTRSVAHMEDLSSRALQYQRMKTYVIAYLPDDRFQTLLVLVLMVVVAVAAKGFFEFGQDSLVGSVMHRSLFDLRNRFYRNVLRLDVSQFGDEGSHELMARFTNDSNTLGEGIKTLYGRVVGEPLRAAGCVVLACWISWQLTFLFLVLVPIALFILANVGRAMKRASRKLLEQMSSIYKILQETFRNVRVVKAYTSEAHERRRFRTATRDYYRKAMQVVNIDAAASPVIEVLGVAAVSAALLVGAWLVLEKRTHLLGLRMASQPIEAETLLQLYALLAAIADPVRKLSSVYTKLQSGAAAADRIFTILDRQPTIDRNADRPPPGRLAQGIEFRDVCFSYVKSTKDAVLSHVRLTVRAGETIALVGRNGCGKSTLLNLLTRFYDPDHGSILFDGVDLRQLNLRGLRRQIGLVTQDPLLFDDTITANVRYARRNATLEEVEQAMQRAFVHEFLDRLPRGADTRLGEAGVNVSGGQKQRIALARAMLRDPSILILDEFTSAIDPHSESLIHEAVSDFKRGRTTFVITHRLNTLEIADRIVVLEAGQVLAVGTHAELLRSCELYQRLHEAHGQRKAA